jgi:hypothetical protein
MKFKQTAEKRFLGVSTQQEFLQLALRRDSIASIRAEVVRDRLGMAERARQEIIALMVAVEARLLSQQTGRYADQDRLEPRKSSCSASVKRGAWR